jgi:glc operon protein GlcG
MTKSPVLPAAMLFALITSTAFAQAQGPKPYGPPIGVESAKKIASVALAEARKNNWYMAVAVVDPSGTLVYYEKMDNTQTGSASVSIDKARTASLFKRPSKTFQDMVAGGGQGLRILGLPGAVPIEGGVPLIVDGRVVGAIGVSGDSADHDGICAQAGADALK